MSANDAVIRLGLGCQRPTGITCRTSDQEQLDCQGRTDRPVPNAANWAAAIKGIGSRWKFNEWLLEFCAERLADYKRPRKLHFTDELPRNATGKVMKHQLVES